MHSENKRIFWLFDFVLAISIQVDSGLQYAIVVYKKMVLNGLPKDSYFSTFMYNFEIEKITSDTYRRYDLQRISIDDETLFCFISRPQEVSY